MNGIPAIGYSVGQSIARLPLRVARRAVRALRNRLGPAQLKRWKRELLFPIRNRLLRGTPVSVAIDGVSVWLAPRSERAAEYWSGLRSDSQELRFLLAILEPGMTFFDAGANEGLFALTAAKKLGSGRVYAFEPRGRAYQVLEQNLHLNGVQNVEAIRVALGEFTGEMLLPANTQCTDGLQAGERVAPMDSQAPGREKVCVTTLDAFLEARAIPSVDAIRVDVGGAELPMFRGARNLLAQDAAPLIFYGGYGSKTKRFGYHPVETMWLLNEYGYSLFVLDTETGQVAPRPPGSEYDAMVVAAKPGHPLSRRLAGSVR